MSFRFASPLFLLLLLLVPVLVFLYLRRETVSKGGSLSFSSLNLLAGLSYSSRLGWRHTVVIFRLVSITLLVFTLARPQTGQAKEIIKGEGIDIVLVLDVSGSMAAEDFQPKNRLEAAKDVIHEFVAGREYDRIGLVVFARQSFTQVPLTLDYDVLLDLLDQIRLGPEMGLEDGTAIGIAIANATNRLNDSTANSKVVILLTDGVNNAGQIDPATAAQIARTLGVRIYTIGAGRPGNAPYPVQDPIFGKHYVNLPSELDEDSLRQIAEISGGLYFRATDSQALHQIYQRISEMEKTEVEVRRYTRYRELAYFFALPALGFILIEILLTNTVFRKIP
jgi:Ca-activated chloride channel family protein